MNRKISLGLLFIFFSLTGFSQNWFYDFNEASDKAKKEDKSLILVFQGSDWCAPCMKLDKYIWQSEEFIKYADSNFVMIKADFPRQKKNKLSKEQEKKNYELADKYNPNGIFPLVVIFNSEGEQKRTTGFKKISPNEYIEHLNSILNK